MKEKNLKKLYTNFGGLAGTYEQFVSILDQVTGDYTCLIIKKRTQTNVVEDNLFWYKTKVLPDWKFGCKEYREWGDKYYNKNYSDKDEIDKNIL